MDKTNIMVEFRILGDDFSLDYVTNKLSIKPKYYWVKGDKIRNTEHIRQCTCWAISTGYEESLDIYEQINKIMKLIKIKKNELIELRENYELDYRFDIVIKIENGHTPAVYINKEEIEFANKIKAEFDFDLYANS